MNKYNIESAFLNYLKVEKMDIETMTPEKLKETKHAFFAGYSYLLAAMETISDLPTEEEAVFVYKNFYNQIEEFFKVEIVKNSKLNYI
jgi:hypothetical protein